MSSERILVFGSRGWIGSSVVKHLLGMPNAPMVITASSRADNELEVAHELDLHKPTHVASFIGRTHGPGYSTIDYLEQPGKLQENVRDNLFSPIVLALLCQERGIHFTYLGTGCIFDGDTPDNLGYTEMSLPNFFGSSYSTVKGFTDRLMHMQHIRENTLNVRIRMPITDEMNPRNFITKITNYKKICSLPNSMSVLPTLIPIMVDMMLKRRVGTINLTNPGCITHNEILGMYTEIVDPSFTWENFTIDEQDQILASKRSNNFLNTSMLTQLYPEVPDIATAVRECLENIAVNALLSVNAC